MTDFLRQDAEFFKSTFHPGGEVEIGMQAAVCAAIVLGGDRFYEMHRRVPVYAAGITYCAVPDDDGLPFLAFRGVDANKPEIVVHEMAHAFHAFFLPDLTKQASDDVCEAVAGVAEQRLAYLYPRHYSVVQQRLSLFSRKARERIEAHRDDVDTDFLILAQYVLEDCYHGA